MRWHLIWPSILAVLAQSRLGDSLKDAELESGLLSEAESHFSFMQRIRRSASFQTDNIPTQLLKPTRANGVLGQHCNLKICLSSLRKCPSYERILASPRT